MTIQEPAHNKITIVDEHDTVIGAEYLFAAIEQKLIRRCARVLIFDDTGRLLLQQRSEHVRMPLLYDHSASGHVDAGESYENTAIREMAEELGIPRMPVSQLIPAELITEFGTTQQYVTTYSATVPNTIVFKPNLYEVASLRWISLEDLAKLIETSPDTFTLALRETWTKHSSIIQNYVKQIKDYNYQQKE